MPTERVIDQGPTWHISERTAVTYTATCEVCRETFREWGDGVGPSRVPTIGGQFFEPHEAVNALGQHIAQAHPA